MTTVSASSFIVVFHIVARHLFSTDPRLINITIFYAKIINMPNYDNTVGFCVTLL
jgi:hypothetical protein